MNYLRININLLFSLKSPIDIPLKDRFILNVGNPSGGQNLADNAPLILPTFNKVYTLANNTSFVAPGRMLLNIASTRSSAVLHRVI